MKKAALGRPFFLPGENQATPAFTFFECALYIHTVLPPLQWPVMPGFFALAPFCFSAQASVASGSCGASIP